MADFTKNNEQQAEIFSKAVRAGKRTYFFDVRATRSNDYYLTITESKKRMNDGGDKPFYEKHKLFLYKEDFEKFVSGLNDAIGHIRENQTIVERVPNPDGYSTTKNTEEGAAQPQNDPTPEKDSDTSRFTNVEFDDLGKDKPE